MSYHDLRQPNPNIEVPTRASNGTMPYVYECPDCHDVRPYSYAPDACWNCGNLTYPRPVEVKP